MINDRYPNLEALVIDADREIEQPEIIKKIKDFAPKLLFIALGFPYQEKFIFHNLQQLPTVRLALGIGGSFDFLTGKTRRAPKTWRFLGLEWFWRLLTTPRDEYYRHRRRRIYRATVVFLGRVLMTRFVKPFLYRPNVVAWLYKNTPAGPQVLIVEREDDAGHWQLPQGGTDGENPAQAGTRELKEEIGTDKFMAVKIYKNIWRYDFIKNPSPESPRINPSMLLAGNKNMRSNYRGQRQSLFIARFLGEDKDIKINFWDHRAWRWVPAENLPEAVHPVRRASTEFFLKKFKTLK
jgi:8-oxo-dGTP pyrophosphatase MutT (NUDIX family)